MITWEIKGEEFYSLEDAIEYIKESEPLKDTFNFIEYDDEFKISEVSIEVSPYCPMPEGDGYGDWCYDNNAERMGE